MNMERRYDGHGSTVTEFLAVAPGEMDGDLCGIWSIIATGKWGFGFRGQDLRDFVHLYVKRMIESGGVVIDEARDDAHYWEHATRFGALPDEIAGNVVAEWVAQGEPEINGYEGIAFTLPDYLDSIDNIRAAYRK